MNAMCVVCLRILQGGDKVEVIISPTSYSGNSDAEYDFRDKLAVSKGEKLPIRQCQGVALSTKDGSALYLFGA